MIEALFIFTAAMSILAAFKLTGYIFGNGVSLPALFPGVPLLQYLTPTHFIILYPSVMFQVWFWTNKLGVFV